MNAIDPVSRHPEDAHWCAALAAIRAGRPGGASYWDGIFGPLCGGQVDDLLVVGQIGQSLDGRAATTTGHSHYINGADGLDHLHRLRALMDAVVVGVGTALADDPLLTVRRVAGPHPARVIIDPRGRLPATARAFRDDGVRRLVLTAGSAGTAPPAGRRAGHRRRPGPP
jgi:diaminohydroxyphosphoribosylaminopyrimidine deaminase/5-amino-6-(5-phosphoribosylamino)uracil reductase